MDGTGTPSLRSCRTYRVIANARWVSTAEVVSSGVVTTLLLWWRTATRPGAIDASCAGIWRGDRRGAADGRVCHGGPRLGRQRLRFREPSGRAGQARSVDSPRLELTFATLTGLERYREYAGRSPSCQGVLLERYNWLSAQRRIRVSVRAGGARPSGSPNPNDRPSRRTVHRCRARQLARPYAGASLAAWEPCRRLAAW